MDGLRGVLGIAISPDGNHVYSVALLANALVVFERDPTTGSLSFLQVYRNGIEAMEGLLGTASVALSGDGNLVFVAGSADHAIAALNRDVTSGLLTFIEVYQDGLNGIDDMELPGFLMVGPNGNKIYVNSFRDDAITSFLILAPD